VKLTNISMNWTDDGAVVKFDTHLTITIRCPRCAAEVNANTEHRCGDKAKPTAKKRRAITGGAR
jgi:hypothetical protein